MNIRTDFTAPEVEYFRKQCNFTRQQRAIFDLRVSDHSIIEVCDILHISEATAGREIQKIKHKIVKVL